MFTYRGSLHPGIQRVLILKRVSAFYGLHVVDTVGYHARLVKEVGHVMLISANFTVFEQEFVGGAGSSIDKKTPDSGVRRELYLEGE